MDLIKKKYFISLLLLTKVVPSPSEPNSEIECASHHLLSSLQDSTNEFIIHKHTQDKSKEDSADLEHTKLCIQLNLTLISQPSLFEMCGWVWKTYRIGQSTSFFKIKLSWAWPLEQITAHASSGPFIVISFFGWHVSFWTIDDPDPLSLLKFTSSNILWPQRLMASEPWFG